MTDENPVTRPDGSIDTAYYMERSRRMRSEQAHGIFKGAAKWIASSAKDQIKRATPTTTPIGPRLPNVQS